jgi:hypothetical protein
VRCAVGIGGQTACTLTDRLIPDMVDPAVQRKLDDAIQLKLDEKDKQAVALNKKIAELEKAADDLSKETQSNTEAANAKLEDLETNAKRYKDTWKLATIVGNNYQWFEGIGLVGVAIPPAILQGGKIQLWNKGKTMVMDWGDEGTTTVKLWGTAMYAHDNQALQFELCHNPLGGDDYWSITTLAGRKFTQMLLPSRLPLTCQSYIVALRLQHREIVAEKLDRQDLMQRWYVMKADDQFSIVYVHPV